MKIVGVHPSGWSPAQGYSNGLLVEGGGRLLFVAGQVAWDAEQRLVGALDPAGGPAEAAEAMGAQFTQALDNVLAVVRAAGGEPAHVVRMTVFVVDKAAYVAARKAIGAAWRERLGRHYPAMSLVQVADLLEDGALVEIEATAVLP